jgi:hypothetical protein
MWMESSKLYAAMISNFVTLNEIGFLLTTYHVAEIGGHSNTSTWIRDPFITHPSVFYDKQAHDGSKDLCWGRFWVFECFQIQGCQ